MAQSVLFFKAVSIGGEDNEIVIKCQNPSLRQPDKDMIVENRNMAYYLAEKLDLWLTRDSVDRLIEELAVRRGNRIDGRA